MCRQARLAVFGFAKLETRTSKPREERSGQAGEVDTKSADHPFPIQRERPYRGGLASTLRWRMIALSG